MTTFRTFKSEVPRAREGGSWVTNAVDVFTGEKDIYLYKRPNSARYQLYVKTENDGVIRESTKKDKLEDALEYARNRWYEIQGKQRAGLRVKQEKKLYEYIEEYLNEEKSKIVDRPTKGSTNITKDTWRGKNVHLRWLKTFYGSRNQKLEKLDRRRLNKYAEWRMKESGAPPKTNHTINAEISTIKGFFSWLYVNGWVEQVPPIAAAPKETAEELRRDYLTADEWKRMIPTLNAWKKDSKLTERQSYNKQVVYCAILIMINSGIRIGELRKLRWSDIQSNPNLTGDDAMIHHTIQIRASTTKTATPRKVNAPTQAWFDEVRRLCGIPKQGRTFPYIPAAHKNDYVFCKQDKPDQPFGQGTWDRCWKEIKEKVAAAGGAFIDEKNISWYSFRHSYISFSVQRGVNHLKLSRNCGTGLKYIEQFYYHHEAELSTDALNVGRTFFKKLELPEPVLE